VAFLLQLDTIDRAALMLCAMFMNAGNYGLPAARFAFGQEGFDRAVLFFVLQAILAQTLATAVNVTILAIEFNVRPRFVSSAVVVSTAASVFTLTLILVLLGVG